MVQPPEAKNSSPNRRGLSRLILLLGTHATALAVGVAINALSPLVYDWNRTDPETIPAEPTFTVQYANDAWRTEGGALIYPHSPSMDELPHIDPMQGCLDFPVNGHKERGLDFQRTIVDLQANGAHGRMVVIRDIRAEIVQEDPPSSGTIVTCPLQGGGEKTAVAVDLDHPAGSLSELSVAGEPTDIPFFGSRYWTLDSKEPDVFRIWAFAAESNYKWRLVVVGTLDGELKEWPVIDPETGERAVFHTAGRSDDYSGIYAWTVQPPWWLEQSIPPPDPLACMSYRPTPGPHC